jgi:hypothetical protein
MNLRPLALVVLLAAGFAVADEPPSPRSIEQIRKEMTAVRRGTDWGNAAAAKQANERLAQLAEEMLRAAKRPRPESQDAAAANNTEDPNAGGLDTAKLKQQFTLQAAEAVAAGRNADVLLAKQVRDQIVADYKADVDPAIKCPEVFESQSILVIDCSSPAVQAVIDQMEKFRGITTLVITGGEAGAPVDLPLILKKARSYPLRELYIVDFREHVTALPPETTAFTDLRVLAVFHNALTILPPGIGGLQKLETLFVDANPLPSVLAVVRSLPQLRQLGVGKTGVTATEQAAIRQLLPHCEILTQ